jgi:hypothetical protein
VDGSIKAKYKLSTGKLLIDDISVLLIPAGNSRAPLALPEPSGILPPPPPPSN